MNDWFDWTTWDRTAWRGGVGPFQARRGDIQPILLRVLAERPMHGYEIIRYLEEKSHGFWRPSPGSVYPTLQLLEEQELVTSRDDKGKKVYELTDRGRERAAISDDRRPPWEGNDDHLRHLMQMKTAIAGVLRPFKTLARTGTPEQLEQAQAIMAEAGGKLERLLEQAGQAQKPEDGADGR